MYFTRFTAKSQNLMVLIGFVLVLLSHTIPKSTNMNRAKSVYNLLICSANIVVEILESLFCQFGWDGYALLGHPSKGHPYRNLIFFLKFTKLPIFWPRLKPPILNSISSKFSTKSATYFFVACLAMINNICGYFKPRRGTVVPEGLNRPKICFKM